MGFEFSRYQDNPEQRDGLRSPKTAMNSVLKCGFQPEMSIGGTASRGIIWNHRGIQRGNGAFEVVPWAGLITLEVPKTIEPVLS